MSLDQRTISKVTTCHVQFGLLVNMINARPCIQHVNRRSFQEYKVSEHETDHSSPSRTEFKNLWSHTSTHHTPSGQAQEQLYLYNAEC